MPVVFSIFQLKQFLIFPFLLNNLNTINLYTEAGVSFIMLRIERSGKFPRQKETKDFWRIIYGVKNVSLFWVIPFFSILSEELKKCQGEGGNSKSMLFSEREPNRLGLEKIYTKTYASTCAWCAWWTVQSKWKMMNHLRSAEQSPVFKFSLRLDIFPFPNLQHAVIIQWI